MRNVSAEGVEETPRPVVAIGNEYESGLVFPEHSHRRAQLLYAASGVVTVFTEEGSWVVPPHRAVWIPSGVRHSVRMGGRVSMRSIYVEPEAGRAARLPYACRVVEVSGLLRALLEEAVDLPPTYQLKGRDGRIMSLILDEIRLMPVLPLRTPLPMEPRLAQVCHALLQSPEIPVEIDEVAGKLGMSRSTFTRLFRSETKMSFGQWQQQARLLASLSRIAAGEPVTRVAIDLGYASPSAFTAVFRKVLGVPPSRYFSALPDGTSTGA
jgi:AraC-like DNA-binding protein/mannose-6-phosphate isomerase-like protein (cupin superfamily)